jgi:murein DD-endopeptidase MepM/ murein hydrolase activator NlpD
MNSNQHLIDILKGTEFIPLFNNFERDTISEIDLSASNIELLSINLESVSELSDYIFSKLKQDKSIYGIGGYGENRLVYQMSDLFGEGEDARTIHLGTDVWCEAGTFVYCPFDAYVHSFQNNNSYKDYGPTIILEHSIQDAMFYSLYGHLSQRSIDGLKKGAPIKSGEKFAQIGTDSENGEWPPHLHFQIIIDLGNYYGDYPGVVSKAEAEKYKENCPDPNYILKIL